MTEYRRLAPLSLTASAKAVPRRLGTLVHLHADQLRLRDLDTVLSEYKVLQTLVAGR